MQQITRTALENYESLVRRYKGRLEDDLELCWDSDTLVYGDGGTDILWLCDPDLKISRMPEETLIALINYDRLVRIRGAVALPNYRSIYTHGPGNMRIDWATDMVVFDEDMGQPKYVSFHELCMRWPGVPY